MGEERMDGMESGQRRYLSELKLLLPIYGKERKRVLRQVSEEIEHDYDEESDVTVTYDTLCKWHGKPRVIVKNYLENLDAEQLMPHIRLAVIRNRILLTAAIVILGVFLFLNISYWRSWQYAQGEIPSEHMQVIN